MFTSHLSRIVLLGATITLLLPQSGKAVRQITTDQLLPQPVPITSLISQNPTPAKKWLTYKNNIHHYQISYPKNWKITTSSVDKVYIGEPGWEGFILGSVGIIVHTHTDFSYIDELKEKCMGLCADDTPQLLTKYSPRVLDWKSAIGGLPGKYYFIKDGDNLYEIYFGYDPNSTTLDPIAKRIIKSFKFIR